MQHTAAFFFYLPLRVSSIQSVFTTKCAQLSKAHTHVREHTQSGKHVVKIAVMKINESLNSSKIGTL